MLRLRRKSLRVVKKGGAVVEVEMNCCGWIFPSSAEEGTAERSEAGVVLANQFNRLTSTTPPLPPDPPPRRRGERRSAAKWGWCWQINLIVCPAPPRRFAPPLLS